MYQRIARWSRSGVWQTVFMELTMDSEFAARVYLDSTIVRSHQFVAGAVTRTVRKGSVACVAG